MDRSIQTNIFAPALHLLIHSLLACSSSRMYNNNSNNSNSLKPSKTLIIIIVAGRGLTKRTTLNKLSSCLQFTRTKELNQHMIHRITPVKRNSLDQRTSTAQQSEEYSHFKMGLNSSIRIIVTLRCLTISMKAVLIQDSHQQAIGSRN